MPNNSAVMALILCAFWGFYFILANLTGSGSSWFGPFVFDSSELPIITLYALYIPIYIALMKRRDLSLFRRRVMPLLAIACSCFMVFAAIYAHRWNVAWYLGLFVIIEAVGACFKGKA